MDYLKGKWQTWYKSLDVNHDGTVSMEDVEESRNKFTELHHLLGDKAQGVKTDMEQWWKKYVFRSYGNEVSMEQFVQGLSDSYSKDKAAFNKEMSDCFNTIFDVIDTNKDRSISLEEFILAFKAFGHENEGIVTKAFQLLNPKDGLVPLRDIVNAWINFACESDSSKPDVIKQAFDSGF